MAPYPNEGRGVSSQSIPDRRTWHSFQRHGTPEDMSGCPTAPTDNDMALWPGHANNKPRLQALRGDHWPAARSWGTHLLWRHMSKCRGGELFASPVALSNKYQHRIKPLCPPQHTTELSSRSGCCRPSTRLPELRRLLMVISQSAVRYQFSKEKCSRARWKPTPNWCLVTHGINN